MSPPLPEEGGNQWHYNFGEHTQRKSSISQIFYSKPFVEIHLLKSEKAKELSVDCL